MILFRRHYTLGELMSGTEAGRSQKAASCAVELVTTYHELKKENLLEKFKAFFHIGSKQMNAYYVTFHFKVTSDSGNSHNVYIRTAPDFNVSLGGSNKVKIYCDCEDFKFRSAYELASHDSLLLTAKTVASLSQALGQKPKTSRTLLCKHSMAAVQWLMNNYSSVMSNL